MVDVSINSVSGNAYCHSSSRRNGSNVYRLSVVEKYTIAAMQPQDATVEDSENSLLEYLTHMYYVSMYIYYTLSMIDISHQ